jgi:hypothetical protein
MAIRSLLLAASVAALAAGQAAISLVEGVPTVRL